MSNQTKYYMMTEEFGTPLYIANKLVGGYPGITDTKEDAQIWDERDGDAKLQYHRLVMGYSELKYVPVNA